MRAVDWPAAPDGPEEDFSTFRSAIIVHDDTDESRRRRPLWFAVKFDSSRSRLVERLLKVISLDYKLFTVEHRRPRQRSTVRSWLPGYLFVEFDPLLDAWQQLHDVPGVTAVLGRPTPLPAAGDGSVADLVARCPVRLEPTGDGLESIARGSAVRVLTGTFAGDELRTVTWSERKRVRVLVMAFNRPVEIELRTRDVEVV